MPSNVAYLRGLRLPPRLRCKCWSSEKAARAPKAPVQYGVGIIRLFKDVCVFNYFCLKYISKMPFIDTREGFSSYKTLLVHCRYTHRKAAPSSNLDCCSDSDAFTAHIFVYAAFITDLHIVDSLVIPTGSHCPPHRPVEQLSRGIAVAEIPPQLEEDLAATLRNDRFLKVLSIRLSFFTLHHFTSSIFQWCIYCVWLFCCSLSPTSLMKEHALLWHWQEEGSEESDGSENQSEHQDVVVWHEVEADKQLTQHRAHCIPQELDTAAVRGGLPVSLQIYYTVIKSIFKMSSLPWAMLKIQICEMYYMTCKCRRSRPRRWPSQLRKRTA